MSSNLFGKIVETTFVHLTAGAASQLVEKGLEKGKKRYDRFMAARRKSRGEPAVIETTAAEEINKIKRGL